MSVPETAPKGLSRFFPIFSIVGSVGYFLCMGFNWTPFSYYPVVGVISREFLAPEVAGPPMFWYGWMAFAALAGIVAALLMAVLPRSVNALLVGKASWLVWVVPVGVILATAYFLRSYFL